jgi:hypothetical protein
VDEGGEVSVETNPCLDLHAITFRGTFRRLGRAHGQKVGPERYSRQPYLSTNMKTEVDVGGCIH